MNRKSMPITKLLTQEVTPGIFITPFYKSRDRQNQSSTSQKSHRRVRDTVLTEAALHLALKPSPQLPS